MPLSGAALALRIMKTPNPSPASMATMSTGLLFSAFFFVTLSPPSSAMVISICV